MSRSFSIDDNASQLSIHPLDPDHPAATRLLALSDSLMQSLYPAESNHLESADALKKENVTFLGGMIDGEVVACGAAKIMENDGRYAEIKRVFVDETRRGARIAERIMDELERRMVELDITVFRLETGISQPAALALYRRLGYRERTPFGAYRPDPLSIFMEKRLG